MADLKISEMTPAAELTGAELIECVQGGVNVKQELTGLKTWVNNGVQPSSSTLDALSSFNTNGIMVQTDTSEFIGRTITGTASQVTVTDGDGVAGNPTISLPDSGVTAATYGSSTQVPVITFNAKGIATTVTLATIGAPVLTEANFAVEKTGVPANKVTWILTALTDARAWTIPDKAINFGDLPSVATTNNNILSGTRTSILGAAFNAVSGTDCYSLGTRGTDPASPTFGTRNIVQGVGNVTLGGESNSIYSTIGNNTLVGCSKVTMLYAAFNNILALGVSNAFAGGSSPTIGRTIYLGSSISPPDNGAVAVHGAALGAICCVYTGAAIINGSTYNCTLDGDNTLTASNCVGLLLLNIAFPAIDVPSSATYDIEFIVTIGTLSGSTLDPRRTLFAKRRVYALRTLYTTDSSTITLDSDVSLGEAATGSVSVGVTVDFVNNRLVPTITGTTGTNQTYMQASVRVVTHINRK